MILTKREYDKYLALPKQEFDGFASITPSQLKADTQTLFLSHFPKASPLSLRFLSEASNLRFLSIATDASWDRRDRRLQVESLFPLSELNNLEFLSLTGIEPLAGRLDPLCSVKSLKAAWIDDAGFFELEDYAKVSAALGGLRGIAPLFMLRYINERCSRCLWRPTLLFHGSDAPTKNEVCSSCDRETILGFLQRWNKLNGIPNYEDLSPRQIRKRFRP